MTNLITIALYYGDPLGPIKSIIAVIIFIAVVAYCCKTTEPGTSSKTRSNTTRYNTNTYHRGYDLEDDSNYQNYDPTWDDAYFEKYGGEPWFDDNPWDHEKK